MVLDKFINFFRLLFSVRPDFRVFWEAGGMTNQGQNPYLRLISSETPFNYFPVTLPLFKILALLPLELAAVIWNWISLGSLLLTVFLIIKICRWSLRVWQWLTIYFLVLFSFPVKFTLGMGQINQLVLLLVVLGIYFFNQKKAKLAGMFLALAGSFKLSPFLFGIYFLVKKEKKTLLFMIMTAFLFWLASLIILPGNFQKVYYSKIFFDAFPSTGKEVYFNQALSGFIARILPGTSGTAKQVITYALSALLLLFTGLRLKKISQFCQWSAVFSLMVIINFFSWQHHLVFLIPCFFFLLKDWQKRKVLGQRWIWLALAYFLVAINFKNPGGVGKILGAWSLSHGFYGATLLWGLSLI